MASVNMSIRTDSELKAQAEEILEQLGLNMNGTINMLLKQIVRDRAVPLSLSLSSEQSLYSDLLQTRIRREKGEIGRSSEEVLADMRGIVEKAKSNG